MESGWKAAIRNYRDRKVFTLTQNLAGGRTEPFNRIVDATACNSRLNSPSRFNLVLSALCHR
jgi:hypothetical protein